MRKPPSGGLVATGMLDDGSGEAPRFPGFFVTHLSERSREKSVEPPITEVADTFPKFRTASDAESQIEADQALLKQAGDKKLKLGIAQRIDHSYQVLFELREKEKLRT